MTGEPSGNGSEKSWLERISHAFTGEPQNRDDILEDLREAHQRDLIDQDVMGMIEGALLVSDMQVRDVMIARSQMVVIENDSDLNSILKVVVETGHSRFPVVLNDRDEVRGILLAKDLLKLFGGEANTSDVMAMLRNPMFIPESKRLNVLLKEFRSRRQHMAIVVDEYGGVSGLVTIEDVLEEIVGEIDDEHDVLEDPFVFPQEDNSWTVKALIPVDDFNEYFGVKISEVDFDTIGGVIVSKFGRVPDKGDSTQMSGLTFEVLRSSGRRVDMFKVTRVIDTPSI